MDVTVTQCYNEGEIKGNSYIGSISGWLGLTNIYHTYSLEGSCNSNFGALIDCTERGYNLILDGTELTEKILANFGSDFKADYTDIPVNRGYPILNWQ